jgi:predicted nucleic acid-binding protein
LVDNSALQRVRTSPRVEAAVLALLETGELGSCLPQLLEQGYSARAKAEHRLIVWDNLEGKVFLPPEAPVASLAIELQSKLFAAGQGRAVGVSDLQIAATALHHTTSARTVVIVHYDSDFEALRAVEPRLRTQWIVPKGTEP